MKREETENIILILIGSYDMFRRPPRARGKFSRIPIFNGYIFKQ